MSLSILSTEDQQAFDSLKTRAYSTNTHLPEKHRQKNATNVFFCIRRCLAAKAPLYSSKGAVVRNCTRKSWIGIANHGRAVVMVSSRTKTLRAPTQRNSLDDEAQRLTETEQNLERGRGIGIVEYKNIRLFQSCLGKIKGWKEISTGRE